MTYSSLIYTIQVCNLTVCQVVHEMQKQPPTLYFGKFADSRIKLPVAIHFYYKIDGVHLWTIHSHVAQPTYEIHVIKMSPVLPPLGTDLPVGLFQQFFDRS
jgi:hypothetical protein